MKKTIFSAIVGTTATTGVFNVYEDLSFLFHFGFTRDTGNIARKSLQTCLTMAQTVSGKYIKQSKVQEYFCKPKALKQGGEKRRKIKPCPIGSFVGYRRVDGSCRTIENFRHAWSKKDSTCINCGITRKEAGY